MEKIKESVHIAVNNLFSNAVRSFLSVLGVVIGIAAVITVLSIGAGAKNRIMEQINSMGVNVYTVNTRYDEKTQRVGELELNDVERLEQLSFVQTALPQLNLYKQIRSRETEARGMIIGVDATYVTAKGVAIVEGRNFSPLELETRALVCMITESAAQQMFSNQDPIGQNIYIEGNPWQIVGIYSKKLPSNRAALRFRNDIEALIPLSSLIRNTKDLLIQSIEIHVKPDAGESVKDEIIKIMERDDPKRKDLFQVRDQRDFYARSLEVQNSLSLIGAVVAGVSLIVGGIGMMNVMLTSVAERTREIGIRRAVGARKKDILFQFLIEACVLSSAGGILGLLFGAALARGLPVMFKEFFTVAPKMQPSFLLLAVGAGILMGVMFGFYPAVKASKLSPAEALRTE